MGKKPTVLVAMSGGVDSSVAAAVLKLRGFNVIGLTMQIWQESQTDPRHAGCCSLGAVEDARRVSRQLGIDHYVINLKEEFKAAVIDDFVRNYQAGRTPNPCVQCNRHVKFETLMEKSKEFGCDYLVTGHYARIRQDRRTGVYRLMKARAQDKDQSYVLYTLGQDVLGRVRFPMGEMPSKAHVRELARSLNLIVADKPDSQEICFVSEAGGYREFLKKRSPEAEASGDLVTAEGKVIGQHAGVANFTIGQRRGLGVGGGRPLFVIDIQPKENRVVVGESEQLLSPGALLEDVHFPSGPVKGPIEVQAKIRYNMQPVPATFYGGDFPKMEFKHPVRAVTPGQIAVAYRGATVVAGATIVDRIR